MEAPEAAMSIRTTFVRPAVLLGFVLSSSASFAHSTSAAPTGPDRFTNRALTSAGNPVPGAVTAAAASLGIPDGSGGMIYAWTDFSGFNEIRAQRVTNDGVPLWGAAGLTLCSAANSQWNPAILSDGAGGAIVAWEDQRLGATSVDIYAQRVSADGVPQWAADGVPICTAIGSQIRPKIASDGAGGAIITWAGRGDIYAQRVDGAGAQQWTADGVALCTAVGIQYDPVIVADGAGGAIVAWNDVDVHVQRVDAAGVRQWATDGVALTFTGNASHQQIASDGAGGAIVTWATSYYSAYAQRVSSGGVPQWTDPVQLCTAPSSQFSPQIVSDGAGGAIVAWQDYRNIDYDIYAQRVSGSGAQLWNPDGIPICQASGDQRDPEIDSDGAGGAIVAWEDARNSEYDISAQRVSAAGVAQWGSALYGLALCTAAGNQTAPLIASDGTGGAIFAWYDGRNIPGVYDQYAQRVTGAGLRQWTTDGVGIVLDRGVQRRPAVAPDGAGGSYVACQEVAGNADRILLRRFDDAGTALWPAAYLSTGSYYYPQVPTLAADGSGGAIVAWRADFSIWLQRVNDAGVPQWGAQGVALATGIEPSPPVPDGSGGAIVAWCASGEIFAQRVGSGGVPLWAAGGVVLCTAPGGKQNLRIISDGAGGAIAVWQDLRSGTGFDIYAQRVDAAGTPLWNADGIALSTAAGHQRVPQIVSDGSGGAIVVWEDDRGGAGSQIYAQRVNADGVAQWAAGGVALCTAAGSQYSPTAIADGAGGAIVTWDDHRDGTGFDIYAQQVSATGVPQWAADGASLCAAAGDQRSPEIVPDGAGGAIVTWEDFRNDTKPDIFAQRVSSAGTGQWSAGGVAVCVFARRQLDPAIAADAANGAIIAWVDQQDGARDYVYLQRLGADGAALWSPGGVTPTLVSLVSAEAHADLVRLTWYAADAPDLEATVYRTTGGGDWIALGSPARDGSGYLTWEDRDVVPGARYGYRLGLRDAGSERFTDETWVDVPRTAEFALLGARPNPAVRELWVWFSLPNESPATLSLYDLAGRRIRSRDVGKAGAGSRAVDLSDGEPVPAGVYIVRLTQSGRSLTQRVAVTR
jgi:hypothetical protein